MALVDPSPVAGVAVRAGLVALLVFIQLSPAWGNEELTAAEKRQLGHGELIVRTRQVEGYPWPQVTVYRRVAASPEEVMAVYADFDNQAGYLPRLVESRIVERVSRNSFRVSYEYEVTGPNERYTVLAVVSRAPGGYRVTWDLVTARYARRLNGQVKVEAQGGGAVIEYSNVVDPGFFGVRLGSPETTVSQLRETVQALTAHVERFRVEQQEKLRALTLTLKSMLGEPS
jgi:hypothetical protein